MTEPLWSIPELAEECTRRGRIVTPQGLACLCRNGVIAAVRVGPTWAIPESVAKAFVAEWVSREKKERWAKG